MAYLVAGTKNKNKVEDKHLAFSSVPDCLKLQACEPPTAMGRHWNSQLWVSLDRAEKITILKTRAP